MFSSLVITSFLVTALCPLLAILIFRIVRFRRTHKVALGAGDHPELLARIRAHSNFTETVPFFTIQLALCEVQMANTILLMTLATIFILGRYTHAYAVSNGVLKLRVLGMVSTLMPIAGLFLTLTYLLMFKA